MSDDYSAAFGYTGYDLPEIEYRAFQFAPWHRPRKQYVRAEQWAPSLVKLLEERSGGTDREFKYLGLPGRHFLDIRHLSPLLPDNFVSFKFLGLEGEEPVAGSEDGDQTDGAAQAGQDDQADLRDIPIDVTDIISIPRISRASRVIAMDFATIGVRDTTHVNRHIVDEFAPFDLINLDLCDSFVRQAPGGEATLYSAVAEIFRMQQVQKESWGFWLTTRLTPAVLRKAASVKLLKNLDDTLCAEESYRKAVAKAFDLPSDFSVDGDDLSASQKVALALGVWFSEIAKQNSCRCKLRDVFRYSVSGGSKSPDMYSFAFHVTPALRTGDPFGLTPPATNFDYRRSRDESSFGIADWKDVESVLVSDVDAYNVAVDGSVALLETVGCEEDDYRSWLRNEGDFEAMAAAVQGRPSGQRSRY